MSFNFVCPFCHRELMGEEAWIGKEVTCPNCSRSIVVERPAPPPIIQPVVAMKGQCPYCKGYYDMRPEWRGQVSQCPHCRASIVVQEAAQPPAPAAEKQPLATFLFVWGIILLVFEFVAGIVSRYLLRLNRNSFGTYCKVIPWGYLGLGLIGVLFSIIYFVRKPKTARRFDTAYIGIVLSWTYVFWRLVYVILDLCLKR